VYPAGPEPIIKHFILSALESDIDFKFIGEAKLQNIIIQSYKFDKVNQIYISQWVKNIDNNLKFDILVFTFK
jgi:hypothetical protein